MKINKQGFEGIVPSARLEYHFSSQQITVSGGFLTAVSRQENPNFSTVIEVLWEGSSNKLWDRGYKL